MDLINLEGVIKPVTGATQHRTGTLNRLALCFRRKGGNQPRPKLLPPNQTRVNSYQVPLKLKFCCIAKS